MDSNSLKKYVQEAQPIFKRKSFYLIKIGQKIKIPDTFLLSAWGNIRRCD